jgi:hypothetical protein
MSVSISIKTLYYHYIAFIESLVLLKMTRNRYFISFNQSVIGIYFIKIPFIVSSAE